MTVTINGNGTITPTSAVQPAGSILQVLQTVKKDTFSMSGSSFVEVTGLTQAITMTSSSNKVLVTVNVFFGANSGNDVGIKLRRTTSSSANDDIFIGDAAGNRNRITLGGYTGSETYIQEQQTISFLEAPGSGTHTYSIVMKNSGGNTLVVNRNYRDDDQAWEPRGVSSITLMEVAA